MLIERAYLVALVFSLLPVLLNGCEKAQERLTPRHADASGETQEKLIEKKNLQQRAAPLSSSASQFDSWIKIDTDDGEASISFPVKVPKQVIDLGDPEDKLPLHMYMCRADVPARTIIFGWKDFSRGVDPKVILKLAVEGNLNSMESPVVESDKEFEFYGNPARDVLFSVKSGDEFLQGNLRYIVVNNRIYQISIIGTKDKTVEKEVAHLFDSFDLHSK